MTGPTIPAALRAAASGPPDRGYTFVGDDGHTERFHSFAALHREAVRRAQGLLALGLRPGDRVVLVLPDGEDFALTLLGALVARVVPVPVVPPFDLGRLGAWLEHCGHILARSGATVVVTDGTIRRVAGALATRERRLVVSGALDGAGDAPLPPPAPDEPALIQFTSGSTSRPKGVLLTHGNIAANAHCIMRHGLDVGPDDKGCSWLPFYHDMGLIGFVLAPLVTASPRVLMPPLAFLRRPVLWLRLLTRHRGTLGFAPTFAYGLCAAWVSEQELEGLDLRSWRVAGCGAEPVHAPTLERFAARFGAVGFDRRALMPCYGMAESTLAVTFAPVGRAPRTERVDGRLDRGDTATPAGEAGSSELVSCGRPFPGHEVAVADEAGRPLPERRVGEILDRGPSVMAGYYGDPGATAEALGGGWLHTGDLGYLADGELFLCGRIKDLIIVAGRNHHPTDLEWAAAGVPGVRTGNVVAFGVPRGDGERVVLCAETRLPPERHAELAAAVRGRVLEGAGLRVDEVLLMPPGTLPKTSSGKLQRRLARERYLQGVLVEQGRPEGRAAVLRRLVRSQWSLLRQRVSRTARAREAG